MEKSTALVPTLLALSTDFTQSALTTSFALVRELRGEWKSRRDDAVGNVEKFQQNAFAFSRRMAEHVDRFVDGGIDTSESMVNALVGGFRKSAADATNVAARATASVVGDGQEAA